MVAGDSMLPTYRDGDWVVVSRVFRAAPGQVVVALDPRGGARQLVKRLAARRGSGWWVVGDNPGASTDSRTFGAVPQELILGRVLFRYHRSR
jgi:nickel-type superoxide dismutase maturation protease